MKTPFVWVVEILFDRGRTWQPVVGIGLTRRAAKARANEWASRNAGCRFRVRKYTRTQADGE
jgi:hypothetical protein